MLKIEPIEPGVEAPFNPDINCLWKSGDKYQKIFLDTIREKPYLIWHDNLRGIVKNIEGKILTLIDASINDKEQREAVKSIARQSLWNSVENIRLLELTQQK